MGDGGRVTGEECGYAAVELQRIVVRHKKCGMRLVVQDVRTHVFFLLLTDIRRVGNDDVVLVTIITDGYENSSCEYSAQAIRTLVDKLKKKGWTFAYIGANQDAVEVASGLNIDNALNFDATPEGTVFMSLSYEEARQDFSRQVKSMAKSRKRESVKGFFKK